MSKGLIRYIFLFIFLLNSQITNAQWFNQISGTSQNLRSIQFINNLTGFIAGEGGTFLKSTNGGNNWIQQSVGTSQSFYSVYFFDANTGMVCGNAGMIFRTINGGNSWDLIPSGVSVSLYGISFANYSNGICTGNSGTLLYSSNGGLSWNISVTGYLTTFYSCYMVNQTIGYTGGVNTIFQPLLAKTINSGLNWSYFAFYINSNEGNLRDVHFFNETSGYAVSNIWNGQGGISTTSNGGANWTSQIFQYGLNTVDFIDAATGYCAGYNGFVLRTTDGGISWSFQSSNVSNTLRSIDFTDVNTGYITGGGGIILKTTNGGITSVVPPNNFPLSDNIYQNYPNPFNSATVIKYDIAKSGEIQLYLTDLLGRKILILKNGFHKEGSFEELLDISNLSSGIYLITLKTGSVRISKKIIVLK